LSNKTGGGLPIEDIEGEGNFSTDGDNSTSPTAIVDEEEQKKASIVVDVIVEGIFIVGK
jgi:hypothetical protein